MSYPAGPYGRDLGDTMANASFQGYRDGTGPWTTLQLSDYYDPDGSRGIRALFITLGEVLCAACVAEAPDLNDWQTQYGPSGARFLSALWGGGTKVSDNAWTGGPATQATLDAWSAQFNVTYDMVIDPTYELWGGVQPVTNPNGWLVDPRTMKIVYVYPGAPGFPFDLPELLEQNAATAP